MRNETTLIKKPTVANLIHGDICRAGYKRGERDFSDVQRFVCFKIGEQTFNNLKLLKQAFGVTNLRDLETKTDEPYLGSITAEFYDLEGKFFWAAYLWNGTFRVGTSADKLTLSAA
jgi:hypothetical protein